MKGLEIQSTPNPNSLKFSIPGQQFTGEGMESFSTPEEAADHPIGEKLFDIKGVTNIFILPDFMTVTKTENSSWDEIIPDVESVLNEYFVIED